MSLVKNPEMTEKKVAANKRNQKLFHGPTTPESRARIRAAHLRHGFYSEAEEVAMRALGEDPAQFQELLQGLWETYKPTDVAQEGLVIRLTRGTWLMNRADRMQEGYAVPQAQGINIGRQDRLHVQMTRQKVTAKNLEALAASVATEHYVTLPDDLEKMKTLHQSGALKESLAGPSPYEREAETAPTHPNARLMRRRQDANFQEVRRVTNLLLKLKRFERKMADLEQDDEKDVGGDV
jgi:hypothetical protein